MKILVVSDTHGNHSNLQKIAEEWKNIDMFLHLGDIERSEHYIEQLFHCPTHLIAGNNDFFTSLPKEKEMIVENYKIFMTHGHRYYVNGGISHLKREAVLRKADIVLYGHTHRPFLYQEEGIVIMNPGSLSYPRQEGRRPSYAILEIDKDQGIKAEHYFL